MRHRPAALALAAVLVALAAAPARADPVVVGYTPPRVTYGALTTDGELAADQLRAQGLVVANLEPTDTDQPACPPEGCDYQLIVTDPAALHATTDDEDTPACGTGAYAVVDADPDVADVDGARLYTAQGALPTHTADTSETGSRPLTAGVGQLCFATTTTADGEPVAVTQPVPIVIVSPGHTDTNRPSMACPRQPHGHPAQPATNPLLASALGDRDPSSNREASPNRCGPRRLIDILAPTTL